MGQNKLKKVVVSVLALWLAFGAGVACSGTFKRWVPANKTVLDEKQQVRYQEIIDKIHELDSVISKYYMDEDKIDPQLMKEGICKGYVYGLNEPYTSYYSPQEYKQLMSSAEGVYSGIGVTVTQDMTTGAITIVDVTKGGPSEAAGLCAEDILIGVDGENIEGQLLDAVVSKVQGEEGTVVEIEVYRPSKEQYIKKSIERKKLDDIAVEYKMLEEKIGYVRIRGFEDVAVKQFDEALIQLLAHGMQGLIVDVRGNPGGNMSSVCPILDRLLPEGLLVYTEDKYGMREEEHATDEEILDIPMAVLTNGHSASASEIFAAALQDYEWAEIVGEQTYGKGIVQYVIPLSDGSAMKLTSAEYFTPLGRSIHGVGVTPDIVVEFKEDDTTDVQLEAAVESVQKQLGQH